MACAGNYASQTDNTNCPPDYACSGVIYCSQDRGPYFIYARYKEKCVNIYNSSDWYCNTTSEGIAGCCYS